MHHHHLDEILEKYINGTCTAQERQQIDLWLLKRGHDENIEVDTEHGQHVKRQLFARINFIDGAGQSTEQQKQPSRFIRFLRQHSRLTLPLGVAAAIVLVFFALPRRSTMQPANAIANRQTSEVVAAAENATVFKISTPQRDYTIDELPENRELHIGDAYITKRSDNSLHYRADESRAATDAPSYHTVSVPAGKDLNLYLADGSKVWVNTKTVLRFPTSRAKNDRLLYLSGEAFFEVASDKAHPFIVAGKGIEVKATGTQFNVRNYIDEAQRSTTLVEGKVDVDAGHGVVKLFPNQQWAAQQGKGAIVRDIDVTHVLGSKDGYFVFDNHTIHEIMNEVSRWYDIEVHYQGDITEKEFGGTFSRKRSLEELIEYLSSLGGFHMKREGRRITIMS